MRLDHITPSVVEVRDRFVSIPEKHKGAYLVVTLEYNLLLLINITDKMAFQFGICRYYL